MICERIDSLTVIGVPALKDNYIWLMNDKHSGDTVVIDPAVADPVLSMAAERRWNITQIWNTHWHPDHTGGNNAIKAATGCTIAGPLKEADRITNLDRHLGEGDQLRIGPYIANVLEVPGHTSGHIAFHLPGSAMLFPGDVLFPMGCGRLFEGTAAQMFTSLQRLAALPSETRIFAAHDYTAANAHFARSIMPENPAIQQRAADMVSENEPPSQRLLTTIAKERRTNPFMLAPDEQTFATLRRQKDEFTN